MSVLIAVNHSPALDCPQEAMRHLVASGIDLSWFHCTRSGQGRITRKEQTTMQLTGKVLAATTTMITTKKGGQLAKTRMRVLDTGDEAASEAQIYWLDLWGDAALSDDEIASIRHEEVTIEIRRVSASSGNNGQAYLNITGGLILLGGMPVQAKLGGNTVKKSA